MKRIVVSFSIVPAPENSLPCIDLISAHGFAIEYSSTSSGYAPELTSL
ncbi:hypothetical protein [Staphylococcus xylosus]|nr:hypothetical protein [Staphylococcus xylosus]